MSRSCGYGQRERSGLMIIQPDRESRNVNEIFYEYEARRIAELNEIFGNVELTAAEKRTLIWLAGWEESTVANVISAVRKAMEAEAKRQGLPPVRRTESPRQGAKAAFDGRNGCQKCFCVTFGESNKACAPYPALITRKIGERTAY